MSVDSLKPPIAINFSDDRTDDQVGGLDIRDIDSRDRWAYISPRKGEPMHTVTRHGCVSRACAQMKRVPRARRTTPNYRSHSSTPRPTRTRNPAARDATCPLVGLAGPRSGERHEVVTASRGQEQAVAGSWAREKSSAYLF
jgi:hypothetical protein